MDIEYFKSAWGDIKNSRGWFGKLCLLALLNFIPIFGQIVTFGYLYGWAREMAWGTHKPLPTRIFENEDGKFWRRGWFVFVLMFVFMLVPAIVYIIGASIETTQVSYNVDWFGFVSAQPVVDPVLQMVSSALCVLAFILMVLLGVLAWVGAIRVSIYDRLSAGFQFGKIWKMMRHDFSGIMRIFGMELLFSLALGVLLTIVLVILGFLVLTAGLAGLMRMGYDPSMFQYLTQAQKMSVLLQFVASAGIMGVVALFVGGFLSSVATLFVNLLVTRAVGYWTMQFEVPIWGGQDDPLPFELIAEDEDEFPEEAGYSAGPSVAPTGGGVSSAQPPQGLMQGAEEQPRADEAVADSGNPVSQQDFSSEANGANEAVPQAVSPIPDQVGAPQDDAGAGFRDLGGGLREAEPAQAETPDKPYQITYEVRPSQDGQTGRS